MTIDTAAPDVVELISVRLESLSAAERAIAETILDDPAAASEKSIGQLAIASGSSEATVTRFCRTMGLRGYAHLRLRLAASAERRRGDLEPEGGMAMLGDIDPADTAADIVRKVAYADTRAVELTLAHIDLDVLVAAVERLASARRILTFGVASSATAAMDAATKLTLSDRAAIVVHDIHGALMTTSLFGDKDVVLVLSHSGRAREVVDVLNAARLRGATSIAVTSDPTSPAARSADFALITAARELRFRSGGVASRMAQLAVVDALFVLLAHRRFDASIEAADQMHDAVAGHVIDGTRTK
jgi:DNA-binding MurR/RpiR family transcriptional regulator